MKVLSKNNAELKMVLPIIISLLGCVIAFLYLKEYAVLKYLIAFGILILGALWTFRTYYQSYGLFYNEEYLILKNKKVERNINFLNIQRIKLTLSDMKIMGFQFYEYMIDFKNEKGLSETISFFVSNMNSQLWEFQDLVKFKSPNTIIKNHASSWEN